MTPRRRTFRQALNEPLPLKRHLVVYGLIILTFAIGAWALAGDQEEIREAQRVNELQAQEIARATRATADTRYRVDLAVCRRGQALRTDLLVQSVTLRRLIDVILSPEPMPTLDRRAQRIRREFLRAQDTLRKSQARLKRERDRNCFKSVRPPNGVEKRLDGVIANQEPGPRVTVTGRVRTVTNTTTVPGPSSVRTRTIAGPERTRTVTRSETLTPPARTVTSETTVTLPPRTETVAIPVPGPTHTVTQQVPVVAPPVTVTVTMPVPPDPPTTPEVP